MEGEKYTNDIDNSFHGNIVDILYHPSDVNYNHTQNVTSDCNNDMLKSNSQDINSLLNGNNKRSRNVLLNDKTGGHLLYHVPITSENKQEHPTQTTVLQSTVISNENEPSRNENYVNNHIRPILHNACDSSTPFNYQKQPLATDIVVDHMKTEQNMSTSRNRNGVNASSPNTGT